MEEPRVSVLLCAYNEEEYIESTLKSLEKQKTSFMYEVVVVDNCSTDSTAEIARRYTSKTIRCEKRGKIPALQAGIQETKGHVIAIADADTIYPENWLSEIHHAFESHDGCKLVFGGTYAETRKRHVTPLISLLTDIFIMISLRLGVACSIGFNIAVARDALMDILKHLEPYAFTGWAIGTKCLNKHGRSCAVYLRELRVPKCMRRYEAKGYLRSTMVWVREWWRLLRGQPMSLMETEYFNIPKTN